MAEAAAATSVGVPLEMIVAASQCRLLSEFSQVLRVLAESNDAQGCVLWENISFGKVNRRFFALAEWFPAGLDWHFLPQDSLPGEAVKAQHPIVVNDLVDAAARSRVPHGDSLRTKGVCAICSVPVSLGEKRDAAINLYRTTWHPFTQPELARIEGAAAALPQLFHGVRNEMGFRLLREIEKLLQDKGLQALQEILSKVTEAFNALESAIYYEDPLAAPGVYARQAIVWPEKWKWSPDQAYRKTDDAMTSWVIRNGKTLRFFDISDFDAEVLEWGYEGVKCRNKDRLRESAKAYFNCKDLPPLSFICAPIKDRGRAIGVIRCSVTKSGPHFFDDRHMEILEFVADQIGERWGASLNLRKESEEKKRFEQTSKAVDRLNSLAFQELSKVDGPSYRRQLDTALELLGEVSGFGEALSVRLVDPERKELYFAAWRGDRWGEGGNRKQDERTARRFPLSSEFGGSLAVRERHVIVDENLDSAGHLRSVFPGAKRILHAPIFLGHEPIGVVDIRGFDERPFPKFLDLMAGLFGRQLGMHHHIFEQFKKLQKTSERLERNYREQSQIYDDFHHQISKPVHRAHFFAQQALADRTSTALLRNIRANARQAEQVAQNIKYFIALATEKFPRVEMQVISRERLVKRLQEMADDQAAVTDQSRKLTFEVDSGSFDVLNSVKIRANFDLLEHAVMNLLDNASKYSSRDSSVSIRAQCSSRFFRLCVLNRGYQITSQDRKRLVERGFRGDRARLTVVEGRGIGLYIVEQFMQAMGGDVEIIPTDSRGINEFRLLLPCS